jgi:hypothetical protein
VSDSAGNASTPSGWPVRRIAQPPAVIVDRAARLAKQGKVPGFHQSDAGFRFTAFGEPLDYTVAVSAVPSGSSTELKADGRLPAKMPILIALLTVISVWPGMYLTDSMLRTYFSWYTMPTWVWYLPLMVLPVPVFFWRAVKKSRAAAVQHAEEVLDTITRE